MIDQGGKARPATLKGLTASIKQLGYVRLLLTGVVFVLALFLARETWRVPMLVDAEFALFDVRQVLSVPPVVQDKRVTLVVYTDDTLIATGKRSPLDRAILAQALRNIDAMGAKAIGIDILLDQPQAEDGELIAAFRSMKTRTNLAFASVNQASDKTLYSQQEFVKAFVAKLAPGNVHLASIVVPTDNDNVLRRWTLQAPGEPPRMATAMIGEAGNAFDGYDGSIRFTRPALQDYTSFNTLPIDLFANPATAAAMADQIKGRYVLIGATVADTDLFETPLSRFNSGSKQMWGIESFAHMITQQLDSAPLTMPSGGLKWLASFVVVAFGAATAMASFRPLFTSLLVVIQLALLIFMPLLLARNGADTYGLSAIGWILGWFVAFVAVATAARAIGSEQRKFAQSALGKYLPADIAREILRDPDSLQLKGEKREIFVIFTDLEGFTKLSHAIEPEMVATLLNTYLETLSDVVLEHGGTIDKFVGDAVVAFWGAPISRPDDGERAAKAALAMFEAGEKFRKNVPPGVPAIGKTRVGLHYGEAIVGNFGGEGRIQYTALGDSMNTASRLESANKQTKSNILVSSDAVERSGLDIFRPMGRIVLRGRATPLDVYEPVPEMDSAKRKSFTEIAKRAMRGDVSAITALSNESVTNPQDTALANFVFRLGHQEEGGYFVLD